MVRPKSFLQRLKEYRDTVKSSADREVLDWAIHKLERLLDSKRRSQGGKKDERNNSSSDSIT